MPMKKLPASLLLAALALTASADPLEQSFVHPPASARPWVYWFWLNGNVTPGGITKDLEAMKRVGIGGVLIMEVDQGAPAGPVAFASPEWRRLFKRVASEAHRLGLQVNMNDDAGWNGSGGPWITPERSMQKLVWSETEVQGPADLETNLPQPPVVSNFYRDVAVLAFPTPDATRIPDIEGKSALVRRDFGNEIDARPAPKSALIDKANVVDLTSRLQKDGRIAWQAPPGKWTILRLGHTSTGVPNHPAPPSGLGLESDKLSKEGTRAAFDGFIAKLAADVGPLAGKSFVRTHIDSWEVGSQNWTARFREEFRKRRGYDMLPYLPAMTGRIVGSREVTERFLWDVRQTVSDLLLDNYASYMRELAHRRGLGLSIEAYGDMTMDDLAYAGRADEPMTEFWTWPGGLTDPVAHTEGYLFEMASAAHIYGKRILGAESFTSADQERWLYYPGAIKGLGDWQLSRGVNRFVFHRYAMQPWTSNVAPGMSMGPWGLHYERTQTWWNESKPWHEYLARCQSLLQQGTPVAEVLYLAPEGAPSAFVPPASAIHGPYRAEGCSPDALLRLAKVVNGRIVFPNGPAYRALVLPAGRMTPRLLRKVAALVRAGATVVGPRPSASPSLENYPACDAEVRRLAASLWGTGQIVDRPVEQVLAAKGVLPDFQADRPLSAMHRRVGDTDVYFVSNPRPTTAVAHCRFAAGGSPELWDAETGRVRPTSVSQSVKGGTEIPLALGPCDSVFVVFRAGRPVSPAAVAFTRNGRDVYTASAVAKPKIVVERALWGPEGDPKRTKDVTDQVRRLVAQGVGQFQVASLADEGDPAYMVVKTLHVSYEVNGHRKTAAGRDPDVVTLAPLPSDRMPAAQLLKTPDGFVVRTAAPGDFRAIGRSGRAFRAQVPALPPTASVAGPWLLAVPKAKPVRLEKLASWTTQADPAVRYFSGTATYRKRLEAPKALFGPGRRQVLDLGRVEVIAKVTLNGKPLPTLWRAPYKLDVTGALKPGENDLQIQVANLWPNRMIGDEQLPEDADRNPDGTLKAWPAWLPNGLPSPTGRQSFTSWKLWKKTDALLPSGLLGPVQITPLQEVKMH